MNLKGKKLLHLGGAIFQVPALKCAKENGCFVILVDQTENVPGRPYADVYEAVSTTDKEGILRIAKKYNVDGVMTYASDSSTQSVAYVAEQLNLPGNPLESAQILQRKDLFREFQRKNGLPHPEFVIADNKERALKEIKKIGFPLVFKPVDSAGTKGQSVIYTKEEAAKAFDRAIEFSMCGKIIIEAFIKSDILELDGDILIKNDQLAFRHYGHNHFLKNRISNVPSGEMFPGFFGEDVSVQLDEQFRKIISGLDLHIGCINFDGLYSQEKAYILDIGLRSGGNYVPENITLSTGVDLTKAAVYAALGIDFPCENLYCQNPIPAATYLVGSRFPGKLESLEFGEEIKDYLVEYRPFFNVGDNVSHYIRSDLALGIAFLKFPDMETMKVKMDQIEDLIKIRIKPTKLEKDNLNDHQVDPNKFKDFKELISPFLRGKIAEAEAQGNDTVLRVLTKQYGISEQEYAIRTKEGLRHYDASADTYFEGEKIVGVERFYKRVILFEPLYQCIAHCRYCLRRNYEPFHQNKEDIDRIARFIGTAEGHGDLREVLVTGGDPFLVPEKVKLFLDALANYASQIKIVRIATRLPIHQPDRVNDKLLKVLSKKYSFRIEVATQINHAAEMFPEVINAYQRVLDVVRIVYNQTVLLKGVNDTKKELVDLFDIMREVGIENHYLFHCVPIGGLDHLRTPIQQSIDLVRAASTTGQVAGRAKPKLCFMTSIGKIIPYEGTILDHKNNRYLLKSDYLYEERMKWNPYWRLPSDVEVSQDGYLCVWYEDAAKAEKEMPVIKIG